ncbi:MAG: PDZ domain-containing protein [Candidatus Acidiferrales bacterium]
MKHVQRTNLGGVGLLLLALGMAPAVLQGQTQTPNSTSGQNSNPAPAAPSASAPATSIVPAEGCVHLNLSMKQIDGQVRTMEQTMQQSLDQVTLDPAAEQKLRDNLADLSERVKQEVEMSSPELHRLESLSAQLRSNQGQFEASANEMASRAAELAAQAQEQSTDVQAPGVFISSDDDSGGWLGVEIGEVTAEKAKDLKLAAVRGVVVMDIEPDGPAAKAGLKENDVITQYDGQVVEGTVQFRRLVRETPAGRSVALVISRNGVIQNISVDLGERSAFFEKKMKDKMRDFDNAYAFSMPNQDFAFALSPLDSRTPSLGISAEDLSGQLGAYFDAPDGAGILIREVRPGTAAEKAGLKAGDVIVKVDGKPVRTLGDLRGQLRDKSAQKSVALGIVRKGAPLDVTVAIEQPRPAETTHIVHRAQL